MLQTVQSVVDSGLAAVFVDSRASDAQLGQELSCCNCCFGGAPIPKIFLGLVKRLNCGQDVHVLLEAVFSKLQEILVRKARDQLKHGGFGGVPGREALAQCELPFGTPKIKVRVEMPQARLVCLKGHRDHISIGKKLGPNLQVYQQTTSSCKEETLYPESTGIENL